MRAGRTWQIVAAMLVSATPLLAQTDLCLHRSVAVNVFDSRGETVPGLIAENFQASLRHQSIKILSVTQSSAPRVVIVLDASATVLGEKSEWEFSIGSARQLSDTLPRRASLGLIVFSSSIEKTISLTNDRQAIATELDRLKTGRRALISGTRKTALWDAMGQALLLFGPPQAGDALYVISDGLDKTMRLQLRNFERSMGTVRVFALVADPYPNAAPASGIGEELLRLAADSGGSTLIVSTEPSVERDDPVFAPFEPRPYFSRVLTGGQIAGAKEVQFRQIESFYEVDVQLPGRLEKTSKWSVNATVGTESSSRGLNVVYPKQLRACEILNPSTETAP